MNTACNQRHHLIDGVLSQARVMDYLPLVNWSVRITEVTKPFLSSHDQPWSNITPNTPHQTHNRAHMHTPSHHTHTHTTAQPIKAPTYLYI